MDTKQIVNRRSINGKMNNVHVIVNNGQANNGPLANGRLTNGRLVNVCSPQNSQVHNVATVPQKKLSTAYFLWLIGGFLGLHHIYLRRDRQAFIWFCTLGGYFGIGWLYEIVLIPGYVRDANEDADFVKQFVKKLFTHRRPPYSAKRFLGQVLVGYLFGHIFSLAIPQYLHLGVDWTYLHWCIPFFIAIGVWEVGNIGREQGVISHCLIAAYLVYPLRYLIVDETYTFMLVGLVSAFAFDTFSKQWLRKPPVRRSATARAIYLGSASAIYILLWVSFLLLNGNVTHDENDQLPIHEAFNNFVSYQWWCDLKQALVETYNYAQHHGWYEVWKELFESINVDSERDAFKVLNLSPLASQTEITAAYRKLSKEYHPDKVKDEELRQVASQRFIEIQQAYNVLSQIKSNRRRKNKRYVDDETIVV